MAKRKPDFDKPVIILGDKIEELKQSLVSVQALTPLEERRLRDLYTRTLNLCGMLRYTFSTCSKLMDEQIHNDRSPK